MSTRDLAPQHDDARHAELTTQIAAMRQETETMTTETSTHTATETRYAVRYEDAHAIRIGREIERRAILAWIRRSGLTDAQAVAIGIGNGRHREGTR